MKKSYHLYIVLGISALVGLISFSSGDTDSFGLKILTIVVFSTVFYLINNIYYKWIGKILNWDQQPIKTLIISIIGLIPLNFITYFLLNWIFFGVGIEQFTKSFGFVVKLEYIFVILLSLIISLFFIIFHIFKKIETEKLKAEKLKTQNEQAKFESLKAQLDPHFLFNNLNVLISIIEENPSKAVKFAMSLSDIYKYVLQQKENTLVNLKDEISFSKKYLELLKARFENSLKYELPKDFDVTKKIPPMSLQILLENIMKHNQIDENHPLKINIEIINNYLIVENNKNSKNTHKKNKGLGLELIKKRLDLLTQNPIIIDDNNEYFTVKIPLI